MSYKIPSHFTNEQKQAIELEGNNILVSAAAGCGKTTLMIERIIRKVLNDKINIDEIVVVTFTEAAAAELKQRLEIALNKNLSSNPSFIEHQLAILNDAYISTFHSLCLRLLEENGVMFNFDDKIKVADAIQIRNLKLKAFDILEQENIDKADYLQLREPYTTLTNTKNFFDLLNNTLDLCITKHNIKEFTDHALEFIIPKSIFDYDDFSKLQNEASLTSLSLIINLLEDGLGVDNSDETNELIESNIIFFKNIIELVNRQEYQMIHEKLNSHKLFSKPRVKKDASHAQIRNNFDMIKDEINKKLKPLYELTNDEYQYIIKTNNDNINILLKYVNYYAEILSNLKKETGILEFNDLEQETLKLLYDNGVESDVAVQLKEKFNEIMIDEYQDTNLIQERIVNALSNGKNIFMVGDLKQSIYRFRNATPQLFTNKYELYQNGEQGTLIDLTSNFRSKNEVLETANYIFKSTFSKNIGGIDYDKRNQLYFGNEALNNEHGSFKTKLFCNVITSDTKKELNLKKADEYKLSAKAIVNEIKALVADNRKYRDIAILFKQRKNAKILTDLLEQENIPYMIHDKGGFYASYEIKDLLNLLKALTSKDDDIALLGALRSYFFNLNEDDLLNISLCEGKSYYQKLKNSKYDDEFALLNDLINFTKRNLPLAIINYILDKTPYVDYIISHNNYEQFLMNINTFKKIINENVNYYNSLEYLINELDYNIASNYDTPRPATLSEKESVVNIMTIHKSKGLEFDFVFLFDEANIQFEKKQLNTDIKCYNKNLVLKFFDSKQRITAANPLNNLISFANKKEIVAEELRVLYVALTRARLQLYIFTNTSEDRISKMQTLLKNDVNWQIDEYTVLDIKKMLDPVLLSFIRHKDGLNLRDSMTINCEDDIYKYNSQLFEVCDYDYSLLNNEYNDAVKSNKYPIMHVDKIKTIVDTFEKVLPKQNAEKLDFTNIKTFDTYKQGNLVHKVFELLDFKSENIFKNLKELVQKYDIHKNNYEGIVAFIESDYFNIFKNSTIQKEYSFTDLSNSVITNGIIDLYVETDDTIYIVDYKSDNLSADDLIVKYSKQLNTYKSIINKNSSKPVVCLIYSLVNKEFLKINN